MDILILTNNNSDIRSSRGKIRDELQGLEISSKLLRFSDRFFSEELYKNLQELRLLPINIFKYALYVLKYRPKAVHSFKLLPNMLGFLFSPLYSWYAHVYGLGMFAEVDQPLFKSLLFRCYASVLKRATLVFVQNTSDKKQLEEMGCKCELIPGSGIEKNGLAKEDKGRFIMVGRPVQSKGFALGIEVFCALCDNTEGSYYLEIYGVDRTEISLIYRGNRKLASYNIKFKGLVTSKEEIYMKGGTLLFLSTYAEGFPRAVLEAWSYGMYVVALRNRGLNDHELRMSIGLTLLSEHMDHKEIQKVISKINKPDAAEIQLLALQNYSYSHVVNKLVTCM